MEKRQLQEKLTDLEKVTALLNEYWCYILMEFLNLYFYYLRHCNQTYTKNKPCFQPFNFFFFFTIWEVGKKDSISHTIMIHFTSEVLKYLIMYSTVCLNSTVATFHFMCGVFPKSLLPKIKEPLLMGFFRTTLLLKQKAWKLSSINLIFEPLLLQNVGC